MASEGVRRGPWPLRREYVFLTTFYNRKMGAKGGGNEERGDGICRDEGKGEREKGFG